MSNRQTNAASRAAIWTGWIVSILPALFLLFDAAMKLVKPKVVVDATLQLGYPEKIILPIGVVLLVCTVLYLLPATSVLGAILLTGYLGGAVASHVRHQDVAFDIVFPFIFGVLLWLGLFLRETRLRSLVPWRR